MDIIVGLSVLAFVTLAVMNIFLAGVGQARTAGVHGEAAAWVQAEVDYLRALGYGHACLAAGTRTRTPGTAGCTALDPALPAAFTRATITVEADVPLPRTKRVTIEVFRAARLFFRSATYVADLE